MSAKTTYEQNVCLNLLRGTNATAPAAVYAGLFTAAPSDAGGGTEVSGNGYARQAVTFGAPTAASPGQQVANSSAVTFPADATANWGTVTHFGIFDAVTTGNLLYWAALTATQVVNVGNQVQFAVGALVIKEL